MVENYVHLNRKIMLDCISRGKHTQKYNIFLMFIKHNNKNKDIIWKMCLKHKYNFGGQQYKYVVQAILMNVDITMDI